MSGIEIAGLILGIIPVAILAIEKAKQSCRAFRAWKRFNHTLSDFLRSLELQQVNLEMTLELLLRPAVDAEEDLEGMIRDPRHPSWRTPRYDRALRAHLRQVYHVFQEATTELHQILQVILQQVQAVETQQTPHYRQNLSGHLKALRFCIDKSRTEELVRRLAVLNENIYDLVGKSNALLHLRQQSVNEIGQATKRMQDDANGLYDAIQASWSCDCERSHIVMMPLGPNPLYAFYGDSLTGLLLVFCSSTVEQHSRSIKTAWIRVDGTLSPHTELPRLSSLCDFTSRGETWTGFVATARGRKFGLSQIQGDNVMMDVTSIDEMLSSKQSNGALRTRLLLAPVVAISLLQLHGTPWASFYTNRTYLKVSSYAQLYTEQRFHKNGSSSAEDHILGTEDIMFHLAIFLLELCFGRPFSSHEYRTEYLGRDGRPHDMTDRNAASKWTNDILRELGDGYYTAVMRCLNCWFGNSKPDLNDPVFRHAVYENVVMPLQKLAATVK